MSSSCKNDKEPIDTPKKRNKNAGKQQAVERTAVKTAVKTRPIAFIFFLVKYSYI